MKQFLLIPTGFVVLLTALTACTTLSPEDRAFLADARHVAEQAKNEAVQAAADAQAASKAAETAAATAASASEKSDRIYQQGQNK